LTDSSAGLLWHRVFDSETKYLTPAEPKESTAWDSTRLASSWGWRPMP